MLNELMLTVCGVFRFARCGLPLPIELVTVVLFTAVSYFMEFEKNYGIQTVGEIPEK